MEKLRSFGRIVTRIFKAALKPFIIVVAAIAVVILIIAGAIYYITLDDAANKEGDWSSTPYAAGQYTSNINIDANGNMMSSMTAQEIWDKMIENGSRVDEYLDGPEDLLKLMNAEVLTNYPDTRPNPDEPIDWDSINKDVNSKKIQGIIKFKRSKSDGTTSTMTYVDPNTFHGWIEQYNETGDQSIRNQVLNHFTLEKDISVNYNRGNLDYSVNDLVTNISDAIVASAQNTPSPGAGWCEAWAETVYRNAGLQVPYYATAYEAYKACVISTSMDNIPVGAAVFGTGSGSYAGHVGIYIGNGMVMDNIGNIATSTLEDWVSWQANNSTVLGVNPGWLGWGWLCEEPTEIISGNENSNDTEEDDSDDSIENEEGLIDKTDMQLITADGKVTFYNADGSAMEGGKDNALGYAIEEGQVAMSYSNFQQYKNSVIYIETSSYGEGSAANGRFVYVTDNGPGVADNQIDVYANVDQTTLNAEPYGTYNSGAKFYLVEQNVTFEDYQSRYQGKTTVQTNESANNNSKYQVVVATWNETQEIVTSTDPDVAQKNNTIYRMTTQKVNYQEMVKNYTMPFDYLWALLVVGEEKNFVMELADLVYDSQIEFTVYDNLTVTTNVENHDYTKIITVSTDSGVRTETRHYRTTYTTISRINTLNVSLTRANTWIVDYNKEYTYEVPDKITTTGDAEDDGEGGTISSSNTIEKNNYVSSPSANLIEKTDPNSDTDNFVTIFLKNENYTARNNILSVSLPPSDWLIEILESNDKTKDLLVDLTKYLLYKATGNEAYGVTEFDFSIFEPGSFSSVSSFYGNTVQEKVWFALRNAGYSEIATAAVMGNIQYESNFDSSLIEYGNGVGFGLCQWSYDRRTAIEAYAASKGVDASDIQTQIEFLLAELTPGGGANGYASYEIGGRSSTAYDGNSYVASDWQNATDVRTATVAFMALFERPSEDPSINHMSGRITAAQEYYNEFQGRTAPTSDDRIGEITLSEPNATTMASMLSEAIRIAEDDSYTYSQANRYGERQYDCSSFVERLYEEFFNIDVPSTTDGYSTSSSAYVGPIGSVELQPGDVLWRDGHVEIYLGNGLKVGARSARVAAPDQIKIDNYSASQFTHVYRFIK